MRIGWDPVLWGEEYAPLIATICDQWINAEDAWKYPAWLYNEINGLDPQSLLKADHRELLRRYLRDKWPRGMRRERREEYLEEIPQYIRNAVSFFIEQGYSPVTMFENREYGSLEVYFVLRVIPGIGSKKANMIVRDFIYRSKNVIERHPWFDQIKKRCLRFKVVDEQLLDMPIDIHVVKVFNRLFGRNVRRRSKEKWCKEVQQSTPDILAFSRLVYPEFPSKLDQVFWTVGREFCKGRNPKCSECPLNDICDYYKRYIMR